MKKILYYTVGGCLFLGLAYGSLYFYFQYKSSLPEKNIWTTERVLPESLDMRSYLAGNYARQKGLTDKALDSYLNVLKKDPKNTRLIQDVYLLAMIQGRPESAEPYLESVSKENSNKFMVDYFQALQAIKLGKTEQALRLLEHKNKQAVDKILIPLISSWIYAKQGNRPKAIQVLDKIKDPQFAFTKGYQRFLLGAYFNDSEIIQLGLLQMQGKRLPAIGYFPLVKKHTEKKQKWEKSDLFEQFQKTIKNYPATAELMVQKGEEKLTIESGLSESLYLISADSGNGLLTKEEALFFNSLALYLNPKKQLALIWGAELSESLELPHVCLQYFERITPKNATLRFKQASVLVELGKAEEALKILNTLKKDNQENVALLTLLGQIYIDTNKKQEALNIYNHLINDLDLKLKNPELSKLYLIRANLNYDLNRTDNLLADLEKAHILQPDDPMIQNDLGYHKLLHGQVAEGFDLINQAYKQKPQDPYILDSLAFAYYQKQQYNAALPFAEKALELMPQSALINMHLGDIYQGLGRHRESRFQYKKALDLKVDLPKKFESKLLKQLSQN